MTAHNLDRPDDSLRALDAASLQRELQKLGVTRGSVVIVHASLSAFGTVKGGADAVVKALLGCLGDAGTLVVPTFTPQVSDPHPDIATADDPAVQRARRLVPLFDATTPTPMGAVPNAVLAHPQHRRSTHPQASVAAIGAHAAHVTADHPLAYALGEHSPFERLHQLGAWILLLGVGHNRNSFLHYAESLSDRHRTKQRRFPRIVDNKRCWMGAPDVGDDNGLFFPRVGSEADEAGLIRHCRMGSAHCQLMESVSFVEFAKQRFDSLLPHKP